MDYRYLGTDTILSAESNKEIIEQMNLNSFFGYKKDLNEFMNEVSKNCFRQNGAKIRCNDADNFIKDLIKNKFIEIINE